MASIFPEGLQPTIQDSLAITLKKILEIAIDGGFGPTPPPGEFYFRRPGGVDVYHRPDGTSFYLRH